MHEVSLGGTLCDYLTGEARERTTYEDLRQALARFLVEERGYAPASLRPRFSVTYAAEGETHSRDVDVAALDDDGNPLIFFIFCPGQVHTYQREAAALARLALPHPCPLVAVTDMKEAELFAASDLTPLVHGLAALPAAEALPGVAMAHPCPTLSAERREKESRILHAYTGFLKTCCGESCVVGTGDT